MKIAPEYFAKSQAVWGLLEYKPQWTLTFKGWLIIWAIFLVLGIVFIRTIQPFLAMNEPKEANILVVEGWVADRVIKGAMKEFKKGNYQLIITTGSSLHRGSFLSQYKNYAEMTAASLIALGVPENKIIPLPTPKVKKDRTAASAEAIKAWITKSNLPITALNIYTFDVHTRRSWYIFKRVLSPDIKVGAIAYRGDYNPQKWWTSSSGVRSVLSELIAYLYARFFWKIGNRE